MIFPLCTTIAHVKLNSKDVIKMLAFTFNLSQWQLPFSNYCHFCRLFPFSGAQKYLYNLLTSSFMAKSGPFPRYFKTDEADKRTGIHFGCWIDVSQLCDWSYQYEVQGHVNMMEAIIRLNKQNKAIGQNARSGVDKSRVWYIFWEKELDRIFWEKELVS